METELDFDSCKHVPWYIPLLVSEVLLATDPADERRRLRTALPDIKRQALGYWESHKPYAQEPAAEAFGIHLHGGLDLLGTVGVCRALRCRLAAANRLARSVGVFADVVWISDPLTFDILEFGRATNAKLHALAEDALVLAAIYPLIAAGIVRFRPSALLQCSGCLQQFEQQVDDAVTSAFPGFVEAMSINAEAGGFWVDTGNAYEPPLHLLFNGADSSQAEDFLRAALRRDLRAALFVTQEAHLLGGALFSNSRFALSGLLSLKATTQQRRISRPRVFSDADGLDFPWLSALSPMQIVELRSEASKALPAFRESMATVLSAERNFPISTEAARTRVDELRERAVYVRQELETIGKSSERFWNTTYAVLGLSVSAYGLTNHPAAAMAGLLPIIQNMLTHKKGLPRERERLLCDPAYIFVKAQDLLAHG